jgi:type IV secretion system protein VirB11
MSISKPMAALASNAFHPINELLDQSDLVEICVNKPGEIFVERLGGSQRMERLAVPELTRERIRYMAERVAALSNQFINEENPLLSASLPGGERIQVVLPPASADGGAFSIRKQSIRNLRLTDYSSNGRLAQINVADELNAYTEDELELSRLLQANEITRFLSEAVKRRFSILISGGTGSGKTTFLNALLAEIPEGERVLTIEDTLELTPPQENVVRLVASRGEQGISAVSARKLVEASLRMRPDRLLLGEIRGEEAIDLLQAINTGHPGSLTTIHANSPREAYSRLALLILQSGTVNLTRQEIIDYLKSTLPIVVQISRKNGSQGFISDIYFEAHANARQRH